MGSFIYLYKKIFKNRVRKAAKRPATYFVLFVILLYAFFVIPVGIFPLIETFHIDDSQGLAVVMSVLMFYLLPANFISYAKRKGLIFRPADVHFIFPAPVNPKHVLLFAGMKNLLINLILTIVIAILGIVGFHVEWWRILMFCIAFLVLECLLEAAMIILCYGNERLPERFFKVMTVVMYALMAVFLAVALLMLYREGFSFQVVADYVAHPVVQAIPVIGWNLALTHLMLLGPTALNVVYTILFVITTAALFAVAVKVKCQGEFYEDAAKFADDYEALRASRKKGEMTGLSIGKKKKFKRATLEFKGTYARAIFYRQLLEYKKSRFFIFGFNTVVSLIVGMGIAVWGYFYGDSIDTEAARVFAIPGVMAYVVFIFSGYTTKWSKELENPYTYLIPDSSFKKLWHSTKMEHIRAIVDGCLMAVPGSVVLGLSPVQAVLTVILYVCLMANKLYYYMVADAIIGKTLGNTGRSLVKLLLQGLAIGIAVTAAAIGVFVMGITMGFVIMILATALLTLAGMGIAAGMFEKMEVID